MPRASEVMCREDEWRGLYGESWKGLICDAAFAHPAKYSRALIRFIYQHVVDCGWVHVGDSVVDPFGGVALGGFDAMRHGLNWYGCELESKFHLLGNQNIALWNDRYSRMPKWGTARLLNGDSRKLASVIAEAQSSLSISSPPYAGSRIQQDNGNDNMANMRRDNDRGRYGASDGNIGAMRDDDFDVAISSPPFPQPYTSGGGINVKGYGDGSDKVGDRTYQSKGGERSEGNLETMDAGPDGFTAAISSPPYENAVSSGRDGIDFAKAGRPDKMLSEGYKKNYPIGAGAECDYAYNKANADNLGNQRGEGFWSASRIILEQLHQVLTPGAHAVFVVKRFVRGGKIIDFPGQWVQLCQAVGFQLLHDHHAMLTEDHGEQNRLDGGIDKKTIARKSFFRRLHENKNPGTEIDWENVLCFIKEG